LITSSDFIIDSQGRIIFGGTSPLPNVVIVRLNANGSLDNTFGTNGMLVAIQLNVDGSLDTTFGTDGLTIIPNNSSYNDGRGGITINSWGNIYLYGGQSLPLSQSDQNILLARLTSTGSLDIVFGNNGVTIVDPGLSEDFLYGGGIAIDAQGRVVLLETEVSVVPNRQFAVIRLCGDQSPTLPTALREKYRANCSVVP